MKYLTALWGWFSGSSIGKYLIEGLLAAATLAGICEKIRLDGIHAQQGKDAEAELKDVQVAQKVQADVAKLPQGEAQKELAKEFNR